MDTKKIYMAYAGKGDNRVSYFFQANDIGKVHQAARKEFGPGVSFSTREATDEEKEFANQYSHVEELK